MKKSTIEQNLKIINRRIEIACKKAKRSVNEIRLLLATKTVNIDTINIALNLGENLIGENKVQELKQKYDGIKIHNPEVHFIGHLQSNKIKQVIKWVTCVESIDRYKLAKRLHDRLLFENKTMDIFIQVNTSGEESKFGVAPEEAVELIQKIAQLDTLKIKGLMTIGIFSAQPEKVRTCFKLLKGIQIEVNKLGLKNVAIDDLSMGMSGDLEIAIEEGATIIRIGTAIFGKRIYSDSYYWNEEG